MGTRTEYEPGTFCWADLNTPDAEGAKAFYATLLGWSTPDAGAGARPGYWPQTLDGALVAGVFAMPAEQQASGMPPHWLSYVAVDDVEAATARVSELGGVVNFGPVTAEGSGSMAVVSDPQGAPLALWQAGGHPGAGRVNDPGCMSFNQLATSDVAAAKEFYGALLRWTFDEGDDYWLTRNRERMNGGVMALSPDMVEQGVPPHWDTLFTVADLEASLRAATEAGATVLVEPVPAGPGRVAVLADPQGAVVALYAGEVDD